MHSSPATGQPTVAGLWPVGKVPAPLGAPVNAVSRSKDKLDVFATGRDGRVYTAAWQPNGLFYEVPVKRPTETIALTSPMNATGLFELTPQTPKVMLLPFEDMGVDASWELCMPKSSNLFDYGTIADVLLTIEFTALNDLTYRQQVIYQMDNDFSADWPISFRSEFTDPW